MDFWASYCLPCRLMDETTLADPEVLAYLRAHYVSIKIDVENFDGLAIQQRYGVRALPTMIVFASTGEEVDRVAGTTTATELLARLRQNDRPAHRTVTPGPAPRYDWTEPFARMSNAYATATAEIATAGIATAGIATAEIATTEAPETDPTPAPAPLVPSERVRATADAPEGALTPEGAPAPQEATAMTPTYFEALPQSTLSEVATPTRADYSDLAIAPVESPVESPVGSSTESPCAEVAARLDAERGRVYSLQAGVFGDEGNAVRAAAHLRGVTEAPVSIEVDPAAPVPTYRLLVGRFRAEADARALQEALLPTGVTTVTRELAMW